MQSRTEGPLALSLLCLICDRNKRVKVEEVLGKYNALFNLITYGKGTANSKILDYLGLEETEKAVFLSILPTDATSVVAQDLDQRLQMSMPGHGILFTVEVHQGRHHDHVQFSANGEMTMEKDSPHNVIIVMLNRGYSEDVMDAARAAGATGGTLLHARSFGNTGVEKFFGVTIASEKEILMILAQDSVSSDIMASIAEKVGPETDANAISFSFPVTGVKGIQAASSNSGHGMDVDNE